MGVARPACAAHAFRPPSNIGASAPARSVLEFLQSQLGKVHPPLGDGSWTCLKLLGDVICPHSFTCHDNDPGAKVHSLLSILPHGRVFMKYLTKTLEFGNSLGRAFSRRCLSAGRTGRLSVNQRNTAAVSHICSSKPQRLGYVPSLFPS